MNRVQNSTPCHHHHQSLPKGLVEGMASSHHHLYRMPIRYDRLSTLSQWHVALCPHCCWLWWSRSLVPMPRISYERPPLLLLLYHCSSPQLCHCHQLLRCVHHCYCWNDSFAQTSYSPHAKHTVSMPRRLFRRYQCPIDGRDVVQILSLISCCSSHWPCLAFVSIVCVVWKKNCVGYWNWYCDFVVAVTRAVFPTIGLPLPLLWIRIPFLGRLCIANG
mmetsp:Transcript_13810/g.23545  ORF Transcript_13810/g.23545 Transcript_13810/m.23545 type:complete len:218 (+) Transcript_13810:486-1139(+)